jgi:hypothetical protein
LQKEVVEPAVHRPRGLHASRGKCRRICSCLLAALSVINRGRENNL